MILLLQVFIDASVVHNDILISSIHCQCTSCVHQWTSYVTYGRRPYLVSLHNKALAQVS